MHPAAYARLLRQPDALQVRNGDPVSPEGVRVPGTPWRIDVVRCRVVLDDAPGVVVHHATTVIEHLEGHPLDVDTLREAAHRLIALHQGVPYRDYCGILEVMET